MFSNHQLEMFLHEHAALFQTMLRRKLTAEEDARMLEIELLFDSIDGNR